MSASCRCRASRSRPRPATSPYVGVPVFLSRAFRHTSISVRTDRGIRTPQDLRGRRVGLPEYQLTANVWARAMLQDDFGVRRRTSSGSAAASSSRAGRRRSRSRCRPACGSRARPTAPRCRAAGRRRNRRAHRPARAVLQATGRRRMSAGCSPTRPAAAQDYFRRTGSSRSCICSASAGPLPRRIPGCRRRVLKAFTRAKQVALSAAGRHVGHQGHTALRRGAAGPARALMGPDFWSYGVEPNRATLDTFLRHHHGQGLSPASAGGRGAVPPGDAGDGEGVTQPHAKWHETVPSGP